MENRTRFSIWYIVFVIILMLIMQSLLFRPTVETLTYDQFLKKVQDGTIKAVEIS